jgi:RimJ/RimL family protein N-acetyltransferase
MQMFEVNENSIQVQPVTAGNLFEGRLVRLSALDVPVWVENFSRWIGNSWYWRLADSDPLQLFSKKASKEWLEKELEQSGSESIGFMIRTLTDDRVIGEIGLMEMNWNHREAFVGIAIGDQDYWGKGYGTDAMQVLLRYAFTELNLERISLDVFEYNPRAIHSYEKAGFRQEGRKRQYVERDGQRYDLIYMGILRSEWQEHFSE